MHQQMTMRMAKIWERSKDAVLARLDVLEQAANALRHRVLDDALRRKAEQEAHKLAGSVGTFGFSRGSELAREMEQMLQAGQFLGQAQAQRLSELLVALRQELGQQPVEPLTPQLTRQDDCSRLLIVDDDTELADRLVAEAAAWGMQAEYVTTPSAARVLLERTCPDMVLLDLSFPGTTEDSLSLLAELTHLTPPIPVLVLTGRDTFTDRVDVARLGACGFLHKPAPAAQILESISQHLDQLKVHEATVIAVDDDATILAVLQALLEPQGTRVITISDPLKLWELLQEMSPDLLILDLEMPPLSGIDLCHVVRNEDRWREVPILFLTAHTDAESIHKIFAAGADDYVSKPIVGPELVARIRNRLERTRLFRRLAETDALTGVANRRKALDMLDRFRRLASRHQQPLSFAVLDLDHFKQVNDQHGHEAGDMVLRRLGELLQRSLRGEDVIARWGGEEFVVGMYGTSRDNAIRRLSHVLGTLRQETFTGPTGSQFHVTFSGGMAEYPVDGIDLQALYRAADQALYQAKAAGRNRVLPAAGLPIN